MGETNSQYLRDVPLSCTPILQHISFPCIILLTWAGRLKTSSPKMRKISIFASRGGHVSASIDRPVHERFLTVPSYIILLWHKSIGIFSGTRSKDRCSKSRIPYTSAARLSYFWRSVAFLTFLSEGLALSGTHYVTEFFLFKLEACYLSILNSINFFLSLIHIINSHHCQINLM